MEYNFRSTGLVREVFDDHTPTMKTSDIKKATIAAGNAYLTEYASLMKKQNALDESTLKKHLTEVYDAMFADGRVDKSAWNMVLKVLYPIEDDRNVISDLINKFSDAFPDISVVVASESASGVTGEITDKPTLYGHLVQKTCEQISSRFAHLLQIKIQ